MLAATMRELQRISLQTELINQCAACWCGNRRAEKKRRRKGWSEGGGDNRKEKIRKDVRGCDWTCDMKGKKWGAHTHTRARMHEARTQTHSLAESFSVIPISLYPQLTILIISPSPEIWRIKVSLLQTAVLFCARRWNTSRLKCESVCIWLCVPPFPTLSLPPLPPPRTSSSPAPSCLIVAWYSKNAKRLEWIRWLALFSFLPSETRCDVTPLYIPDFFLFFPPPSLPALLLCIPTLSPLVSLCPLPRLFFCPATEKTQGWTVPLNLFRIMTASAKPLPPFFMAAFTDCTVNLGVWKCHACVLAQASSTVHGDIINVSNGWCVRALVCVWAGFYACQTWSCIMKIPWSCLGIPTEMEFNWLNGYYMLIYHYTRCL